MHYPELPRCQAREKLRLQLLHCIVIAGSVHCMNVDSPPEDNIPMPSIRAPFNATLPHNTYTRYPPQLHTRKRLGEMGLLSPLLTTLFGAATG